jgi:hypothetical protein
MLGNSIDGVRERTEAIVVNSRSLAQDRYVDVNKPGRRIQAVEGRPAVLDPIGMPKPQRSTWYALAYSLLRYLRTAVVADQLWQALNVSSLMRCMHLGHHAMRNMFTQFAGLMHTAADIDIHATGPAMSFLQLSAKVAQEQGVAPPVVGSAVHSNHDQ